jgi:hypothetical protein
MSSVDKPDFRALAKGLNEGVLKCIEGVLTKHSAAILKELYDTVQRDKAALRTRQAGVDRELLEDVFDAGFSISAERWNGEYGATSGSYYDRKRRETLDAVIAAQQENPDG